MRPTTVLLLVGLACGKDGTAPTPASSGSLVLSVPAAGFDAMEGGANPAAASIAVTNGASGTLSGLRTAIVYPSGEPTGWLSASLSGTTAPATLTLTATTGSLPLGRYEAFVTVTADGAVNGPQTISVAFTVLASAIYVSTGDPLAVDDAGCGLAPFGGGQYPCVSITQGLSRAVAVGRPAVLVADGRYTESITLVNGIDVRGGYRPDTWERHLATTNTVIQGTGSLGTHQFAVRAAGITAATLFDGFVVRGPLNGSPGGNSYAIYVTNSNATLAIQDNVILGGRGGAGTLGSAGLNGGPASAGGSRTSDPAGYDAFITTGSGFCDAANNRLLNNGGSVVFGGDDVSGGRGGGNSCPVSPNRLKQSAGDGVNGQPGAGSAGGSNGLGRLGGFDATDSVSASLGAICLVPASSMEGTNGTAGTSGAHGTAVAGGGGGIGFISLGHWKGTDGANGNAGGNGGGGGGGGAGGGAVCKGCSAAHDRLGGLGGGGGSGGGGGGAGGAGGAGGGAFGLFVLGTAAPMVRDNIIVRGDGGGGGNGGTAGAGSAGGAGGAGGAAIFCTGSGGKGGDGGAGGHGSGGGGGSGGASYAIYTSGVGTPAYCDAGSNNAVSGGTGGPAGQGGISLVNSGGAGQAGVLATCSFN